MPSWETHRSIYEMLSREVEGFIVWTKGLLDKIDKIIDAMGEHDLGRKLDPVSFQRLLYYLWLEFGDAYVNGRFLGLRTKYEREAWMREAMRRGTVYEGNVLLYIPDDALVLASLHHILDLCMDYLLNNPIGREESYLMVEYAKQKLWELGYVVRLMGLTAIGGRTHGEIFHWLIDVLRSYSHRLYDLMVKDLKAKGLEPGYGPEALKKLLSDFVKRKGYYGIIHVNGRPLPLAAAAGYIFKELRRKHIVELGFTKHRDPYAPIHTKIKASSLRELFELLKTL